MQQSWFRRLLLSYFPIFLITITIIVFLSFLMVNEISRKETAKADAVSTRFIMENLERSVNDIEMSVLKEMETNASYSTYLNRSSEDDQSLIYTLAPRLRALNENSELVQSVYLYREADKTVLTERGRSDLSLFPDRAFIQEALQKPAYRGWSKVRSLQEVGSTTPTRVISMYKHLPLPFGSQGLLVINVSMYPLEQVVNAMTNASISFMIINDDSGNLIYEAHKAEGVRGSSSGGKVLTTLHSDRLGWAFESGIRTGQLYAWVSVISYVWIAIGILTVLLAIVYIVYITRKNYRPIQLVMNRLQTIQLRNDAPPSKKDELAMIDNALTSLISRSMDYEKQYHENLVLQRSQLFVDLIGGQQLGADIDEKMRKLSPLPPVSETDRYAVMLAEIDEYAGFQRVYSVKDQNVLKFALMNVFQELAAGENLHSWAEWIGGDRVAVLIALPEGEAGKTTEDLRAIADQCRDWVEDKLRISLSFGIGLAVGRIADVEHSFRAATEALRHKLSLGQGTILFGEEMSSGDLSPVLPYLGTIAELVKDFRLNNEAWRDGLQDMFERFRKDKLKDDGIRSLLQTMLRMLGHELDAFSDELRSRFSGDKGEGWQRILDEARSLEELETRIGEFLSEAYRSYVVVSKTNTYRAMIGEMKSYIEEHFSDPDLSLKHLSDRFQISGKYASYLFKMEFDMKFVDFLVHLRMERAEKLLLETKLPIQDIALQIGYANSITFGRVFKRTYGVAPGDYRKLKLRSPSE
ncbi:helix-turn-helix domain-containing protein [Cohnella hashimotonis]|uniref:Helix-turn-helix domain-containing protein n=1 Tax=Cohnella hashimotonis TaxID=2826895 RepID=A0ABT6TA75_9BACL|nr:helix-turn-helix domain-containing protein [Cohnella hashimotonis]MDI4643738.1 helix-turn-helix domain-containing protein [Cohnella hashimotonis]